MNRCTKCGLRVKTYSTGPAPHEAAWRFCAFCGQEITACYTWCAWGCRAIEPGVKCWTDKAEHCGYCGKDFAPQEVAFTHTEMLKLQGRAPVWCSFCCGSEIRQYWQMIFVAGKAAEVKL